MVVVVVVVVVVWLVLVLVVVVVVIIVSVGNVGVVCALCAIIVLRHPCSAACSFRLLLCPARPSSSSRVHFMPRVVLSSLALVLSPCPSLRRSPTPPSDSCAVVRLLHPFPLLGYHPLLSHPVPSSMSCPTLLASSPCVCSCPDSSVAFEFLFRQF